jgi:hypothetical protein
MATSGISSSTLGSAVRQEYFENFKRQPTEAELNYWVNTISSLYPNANSAEQLARVDYYIARTPEALAIPLQKIYQNKLGRSITPEEIDLIAKELQNIDYYPITRASGSFERDNTSLALVAIQNSIESSKEGVNLLVKKTFLALYPNMDPQADLTGVTDWIYSIINDYRANGYGKVSHIDPLTYGVENLKKTILLNDITATDSYIEKAYLKNLGRKPESVEASRAWGNIFQSILRQVSATGTVETAVNELNYQLLLTPESQVQAIRSEFISLFKREPASDEISAWQPTVKKLVIDFGRDILGKITLKDVLQAYYDNTTSTDPLKERKKQVLQRYFPGNPFLNRPSVDTISFT